MTKYIPPNPVYISGGVRLNNRLKIPFHSEYYVLCMNINLSVLCFIQYYINYTLLDEKSANVWVIYDSNYAMLMAKQTYSSLITVDWHSSKGSICYCLRNELTATRISDLIYVYTVYD